MSAQRKGPRPTTVQRDDGGAPGESYGLGSATRDAAFCTAMILAGHKVTGIKQVDPKETHLVPRPFAGTHVLISSCANIA